MMITLLVFASFHSFTQTTGIPRVYSNIKMTGNGDIYLYDQGKKSKEKVKNPTYTFSRLSAQPKGTETGIAFNFQDTSLNGTLYYGLIKTEGIRFPQPVYFKRSAAIKGGKASINIVKNFSGKYDFIGWEESGKIRLGYRIVNESGQILYDGKTHLLGKGPFVTDLVMIEGPFVNLLQEDGATISFKTNAPVQSAILVDGKVFSDESPCIDHEIQLTGLQNNTVYKYDISYGRWMDSFDFKTAPRKGSRDKFTFAYASDSREGLGGGERSVYGTNAYIMKKMSTLALHLEAAFFQFTGDMINGYKINSDQQQLQYSNWKNAVGYFWHFAPIYVGMGNHETLMTSFENGVSVDKFPFESNSTEAFFGKNFTLPKNGPISEDGAKYDPTKEYIDFPSYQENVYYYTYGNMAMVVLNSNYWYSPSEKTIPIHSGNLHGYLMDQQLEWLKKIMLEMEADKDIDHVFVTLHTPAFPNGGHSDDDMWYSGNNEPRAYVSGKPLEKGIIERRDEFLDIVINQSPKCVAILHGDEHNYNRLLLNKNTPIYPEKWDKEKLVISRDFWQITNGAAGAPYYSQEKLPWSDYVATFSALNALMMVHIDGPKVEIEVINPDTFEYIENFILRE